MSWKYDGSSMQMGLSQNQTKYARNSEALVSDGPQDDLTGSTERRREVAEFSL